MTKNIFTRRTAHSHAVVNRTVTSSALGAVVATLVAAPALAHHPFGGAAPKTVLQGLLSGIGHPIIGFDHLTFVVAVGLLAAVARRGLIVPAAFVIATLIGTGAHIAGLDLPAPELVISASVVVFGLLAAAGDQPNSLAVAGLAALAGVFHGYAYGEAVVGAELAPLIAYLAGFAVAQGAIAFVAYCLSKRTVSKNKTAGLISVRHAGFAVSGAGAALLSGLLV